MPHRSVNKMMMLGFQETRQKKFDTESSHQVMTIIRFSSLSDASNSSFTVSKDTGIRKKDKDAFYSTRKTLT